VEISYFFVRCVMHCFCSKSSIHHSISSHRVAA
jgi:hypothetical protein